MITEDYVSFETAKLLKEKGFPQNPNICNTAYTHRGKLSNNAKSFAHNFTEFNKYGIKPLTYSMAPTLQMAMKWLREEHYIHIAALCPIVDVDTDAFGIKYNVVISNLKNCCLAFNTDIEDNEYDTYEEACEVAIKYCLEKLI